jgi:hypothetical protein
VSGHNAEEAGARYAEDEVLVDTIGVQAAEDLDDFALTACQASNLGNVGNWFLNFRGGYFGLMSRIQGLGRHSGSLHTWKMGTSFQMHEHDIAVMLFCMDSAIECFVFMANALGNAVEASAFRDIKSEKDLRRISPADIIGSKTSKPLPGYRKFFPEMQEYWLSKAELLRLIFENHDVTKHRQQVSLNATSRLDPPPGFFKSLGLPDDPLIRALHGPAPPMAEVRLPRNPKLPNDEKPNSSDAWTTLEAMEKEFHEFFSKTFCLTVGDAKRTIHLNGPIIRQRHNQPKIGTVVSATPRTIRVRWTPQTGESSESSGL